MKEIDDDIIGTRRAEKPAGLGPLFDDLHVQRVDVPTPGRVADALAHVDGKHARKIAELAPKLRDLAQRKGTYGVDARDTRRLAIVAGYCTGQEEGRALSWFAAVPRRAGLVSAGLRTEANGSGNKPTKYLHPDFATNVEGAA